MARNIMEEIRAAANAGDFVGAAKLEQERNAVVKANTAADPNYKWANSYTTQYAQYLDDDYTAKGSYNDAGLSAESLGIISQAKELYNKGASLGDKAIMDFAHQMAETERGKAGYSGGVDGSDYILLNNTPTPNGGQSLPTFSYDVARPAFNSQYQTRIDQMLDDILNREKFSYNAEDDPLYQQYKAQYTREGNRAMNDTLAAVASQAGGMNSYAVTAAQQANNYYASQLGDKIPELYQLAYDMYLTDIDNQVRDLGLLQDMDNNQYNRYRDTMSDWRDDRNFAYDMYRDDMDDYHWNKDYDLNYDVSYGQLTGVIPSTGKNTLAKEEFEYGKEYDANNTAWDRVVDILNAGSMPTAEQLVAAGLSQDQADDIAEIVKKSYDKEFDTSDTAWNRAMDLLGSGAMPTADQLAAAGMTNDQAATILALIKQGYEVPATRQQTVSGTGLTGDTPVMDKLPPISYDNGGLSAEQIKELQAYYGVEADGKWGANSKAAANGWDAKKAWESYQMAQSMPDIQGKDYIEYESAASNYADMKVMCEELYKTDGKAAVLDMLREARSTGALNMNEYSLLYGKYRDMD